MTNLFEEARQWGRNRGIVFEGNETRQILKTMEETGEYAAALARNDTAAKRDALGDILITLIVGADCMGIKIEDCLRDSLGVITKRTGRMVDGVFIKDSE
jgi:NTP pyrophosphatase (non-canonical NTP hydrolase)